MSSENQLSIWKRRNADTLQFMIRTQKKIHMAQESLKYNTEFANCGTHPKHCWIPAKTSVAVADEKRR